MKQMMILVNGEEQTVPIGITLAELLRLLDLVEGRVAVERNREVVARRLHQELQLREGDRLELIQFVGGG